MLRRHNTNDTVAHVSVRNSSVPVIIQKSALVCDTPMGCRSSTGCITAGAGTGVSFATLKLVACHGVFFYPVRP